MKATGVVRRIDDLGRIVIPKEIRRTLRIKEENNWWPNMELLGPCGPDTEIFYWRSEKPVPEKFDPEDETWVEIWNNVFMQYNHEQDGTFTPLKNKNVDTGLGVERVTAILEGLHIIQVKHLLFCIQKLYLHIYL